MGRPRGDQQPNALLQHWMNRCDGMSRGRLARLVTARGVEQGITGLGTDESRVRAWLKGSVPREPVPRLILEVLSAESGVALSYADIGLPGDTAADGIRTPWTRTGALAALTHHVRREMMLHDSRTGPEASVHTGNDLLEPLQEWVVARPDATDPSDRRPGRRIGTSEVESIRLITSTFRDLDNRHGGVLSRSAVLAQTDAVLDMLKTSVYTEASGRALFSAAADLGSVAAWMTFDAGRHAIAQHTFIAALHAAAEGGDKRIGAHILQCMARQMSHLGHVEDALDLVALAQYGARRDLTPTGTSMLAALEARFLAILGRISDSDAAAGRALDAFEHVQPDEDPHLSFFDLPELQATLGMAHQIAAKHLDGAARTRQVQRSTTLVEAALAGRPDHRRRSAAFDHLGLARTHLAGGEVDGAAEETARCLEALSTIQSQRVADRLVELHREADPFADTAPGRELREQISQLVDTG
ncbi:transcriptional regulator [Streptomyces sp. NPDC094468]|uniref:transcriptional regulator n=1 Tax=Streptomyces sp. NPDC094468 TaxID=3366066 RepID=UPI0037F8CFC8